MSSGYCGVCRAGRREINRKRRGCNPAEVLLLLLQSRLPMNRCTAVISLLFCVGFFFTVAVVYLLACSRHRLTCEAARSSAPPVRPPPRPTPLHIARALAVKVASDGRKKNNKRECKCKASSACREVVIVQPTNLESITSAGAG